MEFKIIKYKSELYDLMVDLRYEVLRKPLGLSFSEQDLERDKDDILLISHYPNDGEITGCCILSILNEYTVQLRQMAVAGFCRGKGLGAELLDYAEKVATEHGYEYIYLHARKTAVGFYKKQGYSIEGDQFEEVGIPHFEMMKKLNK